MADVSISDLTKNCSRLIKQVSRTKKTLRITHRGLPIVEIVPVQRARRRFVLGEMVGTGEIVGDIVSPVIGIDESSAEINRR